MANSCANQLLLQGPPSLMFALRDALRGDETALDFQRVLASPPGLYGEDHRRWCRRNWGTDRNLATEGTEALVEDHPEHGLLLYCFDTAVSAPVGVAEHLAQRHPDLEVVLVSEAEGRAGGERHRFADGALAEDDEYDAEDLAAVLAAQGQTIRHAVSATAPDTGAMRRPIGELECVARLRRVVTPAQLDAAADWAYEGPDAAAVQLRVADGVLVVVQGDGAGCFTFDASATEYPVIVFALVEPSAVMSGAQLKALARETRSPVAIAPLGDPVAGAQSGRAVEAGS